MPRISMVDKLNDSSKMEAIDTTGFTEMYLDAESIVPSEENFYSIEEIEELADNMQLVGQLQPLLIGRVDGSYRLMAGHRRLSAILLNNKRGYVKKAWCFGKEMDQIEFMLCLLSTNAFTRKINNANLLEQTEKLKYWIEKAVESGRLKVVGKMRDYLARQIGVSSTKVAQIEHINAHLSDEGKQAFTSGEINFSKAYETSRLPEEKQSAVIHDEKLLSADVRAMAQEINIPKVSFSEVSESVSEEQDDPGEVIEMNISVDPTDHVESEPKQPEMDVSDEDLRILQLEMKRYRAAIAGVRKEDPHYRKVELLILAVEHFYNYVKEVRI